MAKVEISDMTQESAFVLAVCGPYSTQVPTKKHLAETRKILMVI
jgi:hypothetical protein